MVPNQEYRQFVKLLEFIEKLGNRHRLESITLRGQDGSPLGVFTMDNGHVRFGVQLQGSPYIDDRFAAALPSHTAVLRKFHGRQTLNRTDLNLVGTLSRFQRSVFCALTARALRKIARHCEVDTGSWLEPTFGAPQPRIVNLQFWLIELMLAAGQHQPLLREDTALQVYMAAVEYVEEKWLLEWQPGGDSQLWPVLTDRQNQRKVDCVAAYGELVQQLIPYLGSRRRNQLGAHYQTELVCIGDSILYLVSTAHYVTLLVYDRIHTGRLVREMEKFIASVAQAAPVENASAAGNSAPVAVGQTEPPSATTKRTLPGIGTGQQLSASGSSAPTAADDQLLQGLAAVAASQVQSAQSHPADIMPAPSASSLQAPSSFTSSPVLQVEPAESLPPEEVTVAPIAEPRDEQPQDTAAVPGLSSTTPPGPDRQASPLEEEAVRGESAATLHGIGAAPPAPPPLEAEPVRAVQPSSAVSDAPPQQLDSGQAVAGAESPQPSIAPAPAPAPTASATLTSHTSLQDQPQFPAPLLQLRGFTAQIDGRTVLKNVDLALGHRGVFALMGPGGSGKSSLLGILCGRNRVASGWSFMGELTYGGSPLGTATRPAVIEQKLAPPRQPLRSYLLAELVDGAEAAYSGEQLDALLERVRLPRLRGKANHDKDCRQLALTRTELVLLAIARELAADPRLLCIDEPTAGMNDEEAGAVLRQLEEEAQQRTILFITHNQSHARAISEYTILLAAGQLQEFRPTAAFFSTPRSKAAQDYVRTGGCYLPSPDSQSEHLSEEFVPAKPAAREAPEAVPPLASSQVAATPLSTTAVVEKPPGAAREVLWAQPQAGPQPVVSLREFTLRFSGRPIVLGSSLDIGPTGVYVLVVASGSERRLLLRALCGTRPPAMQHEGQAWYCGQELQPSNQPATPQASAGLLTKTVCGYLTSQLPGRERLTAVEQRTQVAQHLAQAGFAEFLQRFDSEMIDLEPRDRRILEIVRAVLGRPALLVLDDPLDGLSGEARADVVRLLANQAEQRAVLVLSASASALASCTPRCAWLVEGAVLPTEPLAPHAIEPKQAPALTAAASAPTLLPLESLPKEEPMPAPPSVLPPVSSAGQGPRGFQWLRPGALAGMPAPGLTNDLSYDLSLIRSTGVVALVTLTTTPLPEEPLREHGIQSLFLPIEDMDAPDCAAAAAMCERVAALIAKGHAVGFHCKAGLGRTGTMLAAQLIWEGASADAALTQVRTVEPSWVQSAKQISFLSQFQDWLRGRAAQLPAASNQPTQSAG